MSQPIKVEDDFYRFLRERAAAKGITIKEALTDLLQEERKRQEELQSLLEQEEKEFESLLEASREEKERLENEIIRLRRELHQQKQRVWRLSSALEQERGTREAVEEEARKWAQLSSLLLPLGVVAGAALFDIYQSLKDNPEALILPILGGVIGGTIGHNLKGEDGILIGTALGIAAGELVFYLWDWWKRKKDRERVLSQLCPHKIRTNTREQIRKINPRSSLSGNGPSLR